jgi:hypothetical protein
MTNLIIQFKYYLTKRAIILFGMIQLLNNFITNITTIIQIAELWLNNI